MNSREVLNSASWHLQALAEKRKDDRYTERDMNRP